MIPVFDHCRSEQTSPPLPTHTSHLLQRKCACGGTPGPDGECAACRRKRLALQRRSTNRVGSSTVPPIVNEALRSPGQPLDPETRAFVEPRFGHDFSQVRVHTDARAAESARAVNALAYTVGRHVVFGAGRYEPGTAGGQKLLAHELTHVVQQTSSPAGPRPRQDARLSEPSDSFEQTADQVADRVGRGEVAGPINSGSEMMRRTLLRKKLGATSDFPDPNNCWEPGSKSSPDFGKPIFVVEATLETPDTCEGTIRTKTVLRDISPGAASGWAPVIRFGVSDGTQGTGGVGEATAVSEESGVVEYALDISWAPNRCVANFDIFVYVKFPESGRYTFIEVRYSPRLGPQVENGPVDASLTPFIRLNPCDHLAPSPPLIPPPKSGSSPVTPRGGRK